MSGGVPRQRIIDTREANNTRADLKAIETKIHEGNAIVIGTAQQFGAVNKSLNDLIATHVIKPLWRAISENKEVPCYCYSAQDSFDYLGLHFTVTPV